MTRQSIKKISKRTMSKIPIRPKNCNKFKKHYNEDTFDEKCFNNNLTPQICH